MIKATRNQLANVKNPYQGDDRKVLCVCSAGLLRSPTMAKVFAEEFGYNTRSAGVSEDFALIPVSEALISWADEIVCAGAAHCHEIESQYDIGDKPMYSLNIPDSYSYNDAELVELIKSAYLALD